MTTIEKMQTATKERGYKTEMLNDLLGIKFTQHVWYRFSHYQGNIVLLDHSYSQNTGKSKSGVAHRLKAYKTVMRLLGIDIMQDS